jgi:hypothetical protein
VSVGFPQ